MYLKNNLYKEFKYFNLLHTQIYLGLEKHTKILTKK